ncbi:hypothetical protein ACHAXM_011597 [Skeletonema potamos]|jgi:hypothetical protein
MNTHSTSTVEDSMTLGGLPSVIGDESEYVFVDDEEDDEFDDDEYDHITDLSPVISCDGSVATELTDLKSLIDEGVAMVNNSDNSVNTAATFSAGAKSTGRRVSNKKRRKMLKMMKKAAAAEKAKEALEAQLGRDLSSSTSSEEIEGAGSRRARRSRSNSGGSSYKERKARASNNFQVACAQQALAAFRKEADAANNVC